MSGPIVRTGATPEFWNNWDNVFGKKTKTKADQSAPAGSSTKKPAAKKKTATAKPAPSTSKKAAARKTPAKASRKK